MIRAAAYARVSTDSDNQMNSMKNQMQYFSEYIKRHRDWEYAGMYSDTAVSGTQTKKRSGFNEMIDDCKNGKIDLILTKEVSRFARNTVDTLEYTRFLRELGIGVIFINDNIDTRSGDGEFRLSIMASVAQEESRKTSERVKWGQRRAMENGVVFGNNTLLGFDINNGKIKINELEAKLVREIYDMYVYGEKSAYAIAKELNLRGIAAPQACLWNGNTILKMLKNEKYAGDLLQKKSVTRDYITHRRTVNNGEKIFICGHHEPIVERQVWEAAQKRLSGNTVKKSQNKNIFAKKLVCRKCGGTLVYGHKKQKNGEYVFFRCKNCSATVNKKILISVMRRIAEELNVNGIVSCIAKEIMHTDQSSDGKINLINRRKINMLDAYAAGVIETSEMKCLKEKYDKQISELEKLKSFNSMKEKDVCSRIRESFFSEEVYAEISENIIIDNKCAEIKLYGGKCYIVNYSVHGYKDNYEVEISGVRT